MKVLIQSKIIFISAAVLFISFFGSAYHAYADYPTPLVNTHIDTTLDPTITYTVDGDVTVFPGATLTILAGTHLIITPGSRLHINGILDAEGTATHHISVIGGALPVFIPSASPVVFSRLQVPASLIPDSDSATQSPDVPGPDITAPLTETPEVQSPEVQSPDISSVSITPDAVLTNKHNGFLFSSGSINTLSYVDISDGAYGMIVDTGSTVTADHMTFTDCDMGILGARGSLKLTNSAFVNVPIPGSMDFHGTFTHTNTAFSNTSIKGWEVGADILPGETMKLDSTDGEYYISYVTVPAGGTLSLSPGVTVFMKDALPTEIDGTLVAKGTASNPITIYGDGLCTSHTPVLYLNNNAAATINYVHFNDLCSGINIFHGTATMSNDTFTTVAGTAVSANNFSTLTADHQTMHDIYQAMDIGINTHLTLSDATITLVNGKTPAIYIHDQSPFTADTVSVDTAPTCLAVSKNSSITASGLALTNCSAVGLLSDNADATHPSGITLTDSEISHSGTAMQLSFAQVTNVSNNKFHDDTVGVSLTNMPVTTIINNWWGNNDGPTIPSNPTGTGDSIVTSNVVDVIYRPWIGMTTPPEHDPIIIVPGITGSVLTKDYDDDSELWPNITKLALSPTDSFLDDLELLQSGTPSTVRPIAVGDIIRSASTTDIFSSMISTLTQNGYTEGTNLFVLPYDWRLSNTANQALLKDAISTALAKSGKTKVNIIAHSMGGLLVKDYIAQHPDVPIDHLFYVAVPHLGAPKAFQTLMYGDDMGFTFSLGSLLKIPLLNANTVKTISQNMPAVYELLPSQKYTDLIGSYISDRTQAPSALSLDATEQLMIAAGRNQKMFPVAQTLHDATDDLDVSKFSAYDFVGCGATKTIGRYVLTKEQSLTLTGMQVIPEHRVYYTAGDGVVPMNSANAGNGATNYYVNAGSHGTMPSVPAIQNAIISILNGASVDTSAGISSNVNTCNNGGEIVDVHSPVSLDIYDSQGNHTGPTTNGDIEFGIPNVQYDVIGNEKFAFLPDGFNYKVVTTAQAIGSFDMYLSHSGAVDSITSQSYFNAVPLTSLATTGTILIGPDYNPSKNYSMALDENGDGSSIKNVFPFTASGSYLNDSTPPVTDAVVFGDGVILNAHDDNSGVLNTKYSTDGITWQRYTEPFQVAPGTTVQFLSIDSVGNTEDIKQVVVPDTTQPATTQTPATTVIIVNPPANQDTTSQNVFVPTSTANDQSPDTVQDPQPDTPATDTDPDKQTDPDDTTTDTDTTTPDQTQSSDTDSDTVIDISSHAPSHDSVDVSHTDNDAVTESHDHLVAGNQLLTSVQSVVPLGNKTLIAILIIMIILTIIWLFIKKRR